MPNRRNNEKILCSSKLMKILQQLVHRPPSRDHAIPGQRDTIENTLPSFCWVKTHTCDGVLSMCLWKFKHRATCFQIPHLYHLYTKGIKPLGSRKAPTPSLTTPTDQNSKHVVDNEKVHNHDFLANKHPGIKTIATWERFKVQLLWLTLTKMHRKRLVCWLSCLDPMQAFRVSQLWTKRAG